jgi:hypothetical protein
MSMAREPERALGFRPIPGDGLRLGLAALILVLAWLLGGCAAPVGANASGGSPAASSVEVSLGRESFTLGPDTLLYAVDFDGPTSPDAEPADWPADWRVESGTWDAGPEGLVGVSAEAGASAVWCTRSFPGDIAVRVWGAALPPSANDLNVYFAGKGSLSEPCLIAGTFGWWTSRHGLERHPGGTPQTWAATRAAGPMEPGRSYEVVTGRKGRRVFLFVDGEEVITVNDPEPLPDHHDRIGLATWDATVRFTRVEVHRVGERPPTTHDPAATDP